MNPYISGMSDQELLARTIMAEAGGEPYQGQLGVASVVNNRLRSPQYPNSMRDVLMQPKQFSAWNGVTGANGGVGGNNAWQGDIPPDVNQLAANVLAGMYEDPTGGALNYANPAHSDASNLPWIHGMSGQTQIGNHLFGTAGGGGGTYQPEVGQATVSAMNAPAEPPTTMGRARTIMGNVLGRGGDNPTVTSKRLVNQAQSARQQADRSREVFNGTAPTSWLNILGTTTQNVGADALAGKADRMAADTQQQVADLTAGGRLDAETIAKVAALESTTRCPDAEPTP